MIRFYSKRNDVFLSHGIVFKTFNHEADFRKELSVYEKLMASKSPLVPSIIEVTAPKRQLVIEYVEGITVLEQLELLEVNGDVTMAVQVLMAVLSWLEAFYQVFFDTNQIMGDVNLRNFIWHKGSVYGIDFEKSVQGDSYVEKAELLARYVLYDPIESGFKKQVFKLVTDNLGEKEGFKELIREKVEAIKDRRRHQS